MIFRTLLLSCLIHLFFLLATPVRDIYIRPGRVAVTVMQGKLLVREPAVVGVENTDGIPSADIGQRSRRSRLRDVSSTTSGGSVADQALETKAIDPVGERLLVRPLPGEDVISAEGFRQYRLDLARAARQFKRYPPLALAQACEGNVLIEIRLKPASDIPDVALLSSSGYHELDADALALVRSAVRLADMPSSLRGKSVALSLPVSYSLKKD